MLWRLSDGPPKKRILIKPEVFGKFSIHFLFLHRRSQVHAGMPW